MECLLILVSKIYSVLKNTFYFGEFEFPVGSGTWYKGKHKPLITKELFDKVQEMLEVPPKSYHNKIFPFKRIFECGECHGGITAEEKIRKLKYGGFSKHIYYHCARSVNYECSEPYITEEDLIKQLIAKIDSIKFNQAAINRKIEEDIERFHKLKTQVLHEEYLDGNLANFSQINENQDKNQMIKNYLIHIFKVGTSDERKEALSFIKTKFILQDSVIEIKR